MHFDGTSRAAVPFAAGSSVQTTLVPKLLDTSAWQIAKIDPRIFSVAKSEWAAGVGATAGASQAEPPCRRPPACRCCPPAGTPFSSQWPATWKRAEVLADAVTIQCIH